MDQVVVCVVDGDHWGQLMVVGVLNEQDSASASVVSKQKHLSSWLPGTAVTRLPVSGPCKERTRCCYNQSSSLLLDVSSSGVSLLAN
jgi:hypothetical protein